MHELAEKSFSLLTSGTWERTVNWLTQNDHDLLALIRRGSKTQIQVFHHIFVFLTIYSFSMRRFRETKFMGS